MGGVSSVNATVVVGAKPHDTCGFDCGGAGCGGCTGWVPSTSWCGKSQGACEQCHGFWCPDGPPVLGKCGYGCHGCTHCNSYSDSSFCNANEANCEGSCAGLWCPNNTAVALK